MLRRPSVLRLLIVAGFVLAGCGADDASLPTAVTGVGHASAEPPAGEPAPEAIDGVIAVTGLTNTHTQDAVEYPAYPPLGGDHYPVWLNCGFYDEAVPDEVAVHDLEHGAVWIAFRPDAGAVQRQQLRTLAEGESHILVTPYPGLRAPYVVTAWGRQLDLDELDDPRLQQFINTYIRAGDAPEAGGTCERGIAL